MSALAFTLRQYIIRKNSTKWLLCKQEKAFIKTLMMEVVFFSKCLLKHNEVRSPNQNIFSIREKQSFKQSLICSLVSLMCYDKPLEIMMTLLFWLYMMHIGKKEKNFSKEIVALGSSASFGCSKYTQSSKNVCITLDKVFNNL